MRLLIISILLLNGLLVFSQNADTTHYIQYPIKGHVVLNNKEKIRIKGLSYINSDSLKLFRKAGDQSVAVTQAYTSNFQLKNIEVVQLPVENLKVLKDNNHAFSKGAGVGIVTGFLLGYGLGYISYEEKTNRTEEENKDNRKTRAFLFGLGGAVPTGLTGALLGGIFIRKRFTINGNREKLTKALHRIY